MRMWIWFQSPCSSTLMTTDHGRWDDDDDESSSFVSSYRSLHWTGFRFGNLPGIRTKHKGKAGWTHSDQPPPHQMNRIASLHMIRLTYSSPLTTRSIDDDDSVRCVTRSFENSMARWLMIEVRVCLIVRPAVLQYSAHHIESACPRTYDDDKVILSPCNWLNLFRRVILHHHHRLRHLCHQPNPAMTKHLWRIHPGWGGDSNILFYGNVEKLKDEEQCDGWLRWCSSGGWAIPGLILDVVAVTGLFGFGAREICQIQLWSINQF